MPSNRQRGHHNGLFCEPSFADFVCAANGLFSLEALWHGGQPWMAEPGVRTHYFDAGMVSLLQGKDPASGILSQSMRSGRQQRRRVRKEWTPDRLPSADAAPPAEAGGGVAAGAPAAPAPAAGVASSVKYIDPAHRGSSDAYKKKVRRQTAVRYGNIPQNVFAAEQKLSAASQRTGSVVDFLSYVSVFAEVSRCPLSWRCMRMLTASLYMCLCAFACLFVCLCVMCQVADTLYDFNASRQVRDAEFANLVAKQREYGTIPARLGIARGDVVFIGASFATVTQVKKGGTPGSNAVKVCRECLLLC